MQKILVIGQDRDGSDIFNPVIGASGKGEVIPTSISSPLNELADRLNVEPFEQKNLDTPTKHWSDQGDTCIIYSSIYAHKHYKKLKIFAFLEGIWLTLLDSIWFINNELDLFRIGKKQDPPH
jgi:hypothetical protein